MSALAPADAAMYWRSLTSANDQFLLFAFDAPDGETSDPQALVDDLLARAETVDDMRLTIESVPGDLDYPRWVRAEIDRSRAVVHTVAGWQDCLDDVALLVAEPSRDRATLWRLHVFADLIGVPGAADRANIVVLQISHALGDGRRVSRIARDLLGDTGSALTADRVSRRLPGAVRAAIGALRTPPTLGVALVRGLAAWRAGTGESEGSPAPQPIPRTLLNHPGDGPVELRTLTVDAARLRVGGAAVTSGVLAVLAEVLPQFGGAAADGRVVAEVAIARDDPDDHARNRFRTVGVDLRADLDGRAERASAISDALTGARLRDHTPGQRAARRAARSAPAVLERLAVRLAASAPTPQAITGATVVSSVNRGAADLRLAGGRVLFTAGFPALSSVHGLTHGVHGIGTSVAISVCARRSTGLDLDAYVRAIEAALS